MQVEETHSSPSKHLNGCRLNLVCVCVCVCARARARGGGVRESCTVVSSSAQPPPYMDLERNSTNKRSGFSKSANSHCVPIRRAAERDGSAFGRSRHPEVMVFLRPSWTVPSVRPRPRTFTSFAFQFNAGLYPVATSVVKCTVPQCSGTQSVRPRETTQLPLDGLS